MASTVASMAMVDKMVGESATAGRAHTPRAEGKIGAPKAFGVPCQNFVAVVVKALKSLVIHGKRPSDRVALRRTQSQ